VLFLFYFDALCVGLFLSLCLIWFRRLITRTPALSLLSSLSSSFMFMYTYHDYRFLTSLLAHFFFLFLCFFNPLHFFIATCSFRVFVRVFSCIFPTCSRVYSPGSRASAAIIHRGEQSNKNKKKNRNIIYKHKHIFFLFAAVVCSISFITRPV
jgi:hypothetical protein